MREYVQVYLDMYALIVYCLCSAQNTKVHSLVCTAPHVCATDQFSEWATLHKVELGEQLKTVLKY